MGMWQKVGDGTRTWLICGLMGFLCLAALGVVLGRSVKMSIHGVGSIEVGAQVDSNQQSQPAKPPPSPPPIRWPEAEPRRPLKARNHRLGETVLRVSKKPSSAK